MASYDPFPPRYDISWPTGSIYVANGGGGDGAGRCNRLLEYLAAFDHNDELCYWVYVWLMRSL